MSLTRVRIGSAVIHFRPMTDPLANYQISTRYPEGFADSTSAVSQLFTTCNGKDIYAWLGCMGLGSLNKLDQQQAPEQAFSFKARAKSFPTRWI